MSRPKVHGDRVTTAIRIPTDLHATLLAAAHDREVAVNFLVIKALEEFLPRLIPVADLRLTVPWPKHSADDSWMDTATGEHSAGFFADGRNP